MDAVDMPDTDNAADYLLFLEAHPDAGLKLDARFAAEYGAELVSEVLTAGMRPAGPYDVLAGGSAAGRYAAKLVAYYRTCRSDGTLPTGQPAGGACPQPEDVP